MERTAHEFKVIVQTEANMTEDECCNLLVDILRAHLNIGTIIRFIVRRKEGKPEVVE